MSATLAFYAFPEEHWRRIRTNNPLERIIHEIRGRTRVVGAFPDGSSALPKGATPQQLKDAPCRDRDGRLGLSDRSLFADAYAVLADETDQMFPRLSECLIEAMTTDRIMVPGFDLLAKPAGQPATFDGEAVIALQSGSGGATVSTVRRRATMSAGVTSA